MSLTRKRLLARALAEIVRAHVGLRLFPSRALAGRFDTDCLVGPPHECGHPDVRRIAAAVQSVSRRVPGSTCLVVALAACRLLHSNGYPARLCIGVRRGEVNANLLKAHAWVEYDGAIVIGELDDLAEYSPLARRSPFVEHSPARSQIVALLRNDSDRAWTGHARAEDVLAVCETEELAAIVHNTLVQLTEDEQWPGAVQDALASQSRDGLACELARAAELRAALAALDEDGIHPILFKGTALAYQLYASPALRPRCDTDLFIRRDECDRVRRVLGGLGYRATPYADGTFVHRQFEMQKQDRFGLLHALDFHWAVSTQIVFSDLLTYDELLSGSVEIRALGPGARGAGHVHALLVSSVHPAMHHRNAERLLWLSDIHLLASRLTEHELRQFVDLARAKRVGAICAAALERTCMVFATVLPPWTIADLRKTPDEPSAIYLRPGRRWHHELVSNLRALTEWSDRLRLLREVVFPSRQYVLEAYRLDASPFTTLLLPALYAHRNVRGLWNILQRRK